VYLPRFKSKMLQLHQSCRQTVMINITCLYKMMRPALLVGVYIPLKGRMYKKIGKIRIMKYCDYFAPYLYLFLCPESLIQFHSKRTFVWLFDVAGKKKKIS